MRNLETRRNRKYGKDKKIKEMRNIEMIKLTENIKKMIEKII